MADISFAFQFFGLNAWAFYYKFKEYNSGTGFDLMGYPLPIAKGCADMMKVHNLFSTAHSCFVSLSVFRELPERLLCREVCITRVLFASLRSQWVRFLD